VILPTLWDHCLLRSCVYTLTKWLLQLFVLDDLSDDKSASGVRESCDLVVGAMCNADWDANSVLENLTKEYVILARRTGSCR
jgi:hypothetical protein